MRHAAKVARHVFLVSAVASAMVTAAVAANQILDDGEFTWNWAYPAFAFTLLGLLLTTALDHAPNPDSGTGGRERMSQHRYRRRVRASVEQMETLGLVTQAEYVLRTRQVYVDVALRPQTVTTTVGDTGIGPVRPGATRPAGERAPLASFLGRGQVLAVLGAAGSGKTTLARYTALDLAERQGRPWQRRFWRRRPLPILLYLRDHAKDILAEPGEDGLRIDLAQAAVTAPWLEGVITAPWLKGHLDKGRCVVLLDGLDEVADGGDRRRVVRWVDTQIARYPRNSFVVTSRPHGYDNNRLPCADVLQVQRFAADQIHAFLHTWYQAIERRARQGDRAETDRTASRAAEDLFTRINALPALYDLAANPLLLTMIANVHRYRGQLPAGRAALYTEMCQVLLHRRQEVKGVTDPIDDILAGAQKERVVQELAWHMMRHKLRDIPVADAARAIRTALHRTTPALTLTPEMFLDYVRRSGLLTEHRYGHYGFVHLTLQEHLAAVSALAPGRHARRQQLIDKVSDPWWRETTLLWTANADATPVVEACLAARTVPALSLAYACAEPPGELDHTLREQLDRFLTTTPTSPEEARLLNGVAAARALHDTHPLDTGDRLCAQPLTWDLWHRYAARAGLHAPPPSPEPATGLWPADARHFLTWLNSLFPDDTTYRLLTPREARQALDLRPATSSLWAFDDDRATLIPSETRLHHPTPQQISAYPDLILDHTHLLFRLLFPRSQLTFAQLLTYSRPRDLTNLRQRLLHILDLIYAIQTARDLAHRFDHDLVLDLNRNLALTLNRDLDNDLDRDLAPDLDRNLDLALDLARDLARFLDFDFDCDFDFARDLARAHDLVLALARDLARDLDLDLALARALALVRNLDPARDPDLARNLASDLNLALARSLDPDPDLGLDPDPDLGLVPARNLDPTLNHGLAPDLDLALAYAFDRTHPFGFDLNRDLAFARAMASQDLGRFQETVVVEGLGRDCLALARAAWTPRVWDRLSRSEQTPERGESPSLLRFLALAVEAFSGRPPAEDPHAALRQAAHLADQRGAHAVVESIERARGLAAPLWDHSRPVRQSDAVLAVTSLLALLTGDDATVLDPELSKLLCGALAALIALTPDTRERDEAAPDGLVFLVRK
ncbi:NACHT domain-containing protein [Actinocorallia aurantiaca]|uniref:NACHT domain-containing protein n=1 Tax=Actinocorallia aurantiaca TaxID=46204 RepID=A0ABP6GIF0_9ACTN